jgi:hypothetical protein
VGHPARGRGGVPMFPVTESLRAQVNVRVLGVTRSALRELSFRKLPPPPVNLDNLKAKIYHTVPGIIRGSRGSGQRPIRRRAAVFVLKSVPQRDGIIARCPLHHLDVLWMLHRQRGLSRYLRELGA